MAGAGLLPSTSLRGSSTPRLSGVEISRCSLQPPSSSSVRITTSLDRNLSTVKPRVPGLRGRTAHVYASSSNLQQPPLEYSAGHSSAAEGIKRKCSSMRQRSVVTNGTGSGGVSKVTDVEIGSTPKSEHAAAPAQLENLSAPAGKRAENEFLAVLQKEFEVGSRWEEIQGKNEWAGLLDPIDPLLRAEVIRYGEFAQMTYDAFDNDAHTPLAGSARFCKGNILDKVFKGDCGYEVTDYLYSTAGDGVPRAFYQLFDRDDPYDEDDRHAWDGETNWVGFVAVTTDEKEIKRLGRRDIVVAWRGTVTTMEWVNDVQNNLKPAALDPRREGQSGVVDLRVEQGFLSIYTAANENSPYTNLSARQQALEAVQRLVAKYGNDKDVELSISLTGHSLGAAVAVLCAYDIAESSINQPSNLPGKVQKWYQNTVRSNPDDVVELTKSSNEKTVPVTVFSFAGPRVGNDAFRDRLKELDVRVLRVVNNMDIVPKTPGLFLHLAPGAKWLDPLRNWIDELQWTYTHVGQELLIDHTVSPFLKKSRSPPDYHNLEGYLHVLSGFHGLGKAFHQVVVRDPALVNKSSDFLRKKCLVPPSWWQVENKGLQLVVSEKGDRNWIPRPRDKNDHPEFSFDESG